MVLQDCESPLITETYPEQSNDDGSHTMGFFVLLPTEILHSLLAFLDHGSLGYLALTSTEMCTAVKNYVYTLAGLRRVVPETPTSYADIVDPDDYKNLGESYIRPGILDSQVIIPPATLYLEGIFLGHNYM